MPAAAGDIGGRVSGDVVGPHGEPVASARVLFVLREGDYRRELVSDETGRYGIADLPPGFYTVTARSPVTGASAERGALVRGGEALDLSIVLGN